LVRSPRGPSPDEGLTYVGPNPVLAVLGLVGLTLALAAGEAGPVPEPQDIMTSPAAGEHHLRRIR
jgi:hypothetical protein